MSRWQSPEFDRHESPTMTSIRDAFRDCLLGRIPEEVVRWRGRAGIERDVEEILDRELARCEEMEFARGFAEACPVEGCRPEDYLQRIVEVGDGQTVLAGIRFHGNRGFPFVELPAWTEPLDDAAAIGRVHDTIVDEFSEFSPQRLLVWWPTSRRWALPEELETEVDRFVHVGAVDELTGRDAVADVERVELRGVEGLEAAAGFVEDAYDSYLAAHPDLAGVVAPADVDDLEACRSSGVVAWVRVTGERAGLVATCEELGPFVRGQCVVEQVLGEDYRGRRLAPAAQQRLIVRVEARHDAEVLWGEIDRQNAASRATAERVGRDAVAAWHWIA